MKSSLFLLMLLLTVSFSYAQYGQLDAGFGDGGKVISNLGPAFDNAADILIQDDGKLIVIGSGSNGDFSSFLISRYLLDGTIDNTFATDGSTLVQVGSGNNYGIKGAFQSDGKIVVAGRAQNGDYNQFVCLRFDDNGLLDESFAQAGIFTISLSDEYNDVYDVAVQEDDKIVLAGFCGISTEEDFALVRLNPDGTLDNAFGNGGQVVHSVTAGSDHVNAMEITGDGKILTAGYVSHETRVLVSCLVQFNSDGSVDTGFGDNGLVVSTPGPLASFFQDMKITDDNVIVAVGVTDYEGQYDYLAAKYNADGSLVTEFAEDGFFTKDYGGSWDNSSSVVVQQDRKIILVGYQGS